MGQETWNLIKRSKSFYVRTYRMATRWLVTSLVINLLLAMANYYLYFNQPARYFYATSGIAAPVMLKPLAEPNRSANYLLDPDPTNENDIKVIPR